MYISHTYTQILCLLKYQSHHLNYKSSHEAEDQKFLDTKLDDYNQDHQKSEEEKNEIFQHNIAMLNINITFI